MTHPNPFDLQHHRFGSSGDLIEQFLATYAKRGTRRSYRSDLQQFFSEEGVTRQEVSRVEKEEIIAFLKQRVKDSLKRSTLKRKLEAIRSFFRWVADQNLIESLPISEGTDTGDLVDRVSQDDREKTEGEGDSPTGEEPDGTDEGDSEGSRMGPVPMALEPGSEDNESPPSESPPSEAPSSEEPRSSETSNDTFKGSDPDSAEEGPPKEKSVEERDLGEEPIGEGRTEENSADDDSTGENLGGEDRSSIPDWALASGEAKEIDLYDGEHVALADLSDALVGALPELEEPGGPEGLHIRCTSDLKVQIQSHPGEDSQIIEASIEHYVLQRLLRNEGDLSEEHVLHRAILYLHELNWTLPRAVYDRVDALPDPDDAEGPLSEERPRWRPEGVGDGLGSVFFAPLITGVLAEGFGIERTRRYSSASNCPRPE